MSVSIPLVFDGRPDPPSEQVSRGIERGSALERQWRRGAVSRDAIDELFLDARRAVAKALDLPELNGVVITSSGIEAVNTAVNGLAWGAEDSRREIDFPDGDHEGFVEAATWCKGLGFRSVELKLLNDGRIDLGIAREKIDNRTALVALSSVTPAVNVPRQIEELSLICRAVGVPLVVDVTLQVRLMPIGDLPGLCDILTCDGTALGGPVGTGVLFVSRDVRYGSPVSGGAFQVGCRSGSLGTGLIAGLGAAALEFKDMRSGRIEHFQALYNGLLRELKKALPKVIFPQVGDLVPCSLTFILEGLEAEAAVMRLAEEGIYVSTGSSYLTAAGKPSAVLTGLGYTPEQAAGAVNLTFRDEHTMEHIKAVVGHIANTVNAL